MREKKVRISEEELSKLKEYRDENYPGVPLGFVIGDLVDNE
jgi:hypothetical protein